MTDSRETLAMRARIWDALTAAEIRTVNFAALANAAAPAFARGWTGFELGSAAVENLNGADNIGAVMLTSIRELATVDPPREVTPTPPPVQQVLATVHAHNAPARNAAEWTARIRAQLAEQRRA